MILYVNGQDICRIVLGIVGEGDVEIIDIGPDAFLATMRSFLERRSYALEDVETIVCVRGPGSATALRVSLSLVQALAFAKGIRLIPLEKEMSASESEVFRAVTASWVQEQLSVETIAPLYVHAPQITVAKRDHLKRSI